MQYAWPVWPCQLGLVTLHRTVGTEFGNPDSSLIMPDFDLSGELSLKIELHMLRPITEKVHSGNGPVSLVLRQWRHQGGMGPPVGGSAPHPQSGKKLSNRPFLANFWIFAPSEIAMVIAMVTIQGLILAKHWNKRNSKQNVACNHIWVDDVWVHCAQNHFLNICHGNRQLTNLETLQHNSNLKIYIKNRASWFCSPISQQFSWSYDLSFLSYVC